MANITWSEPTPSGQSAAGATPTELRNLWNALGAGLGTNLYWTGSGASIGELKPGASRAFFDVASNSSNSNDAYMRARAFLASDTSRCFVYESNGTYLGGTPYLVEMP